MICKTPLTLLSTLAVGILSAGAQTSPSFEVVITGGRIVDEGGPELASRLEEEGYDRYVKGVAA